MKRKADRLLIASTAVMLLAACTTIVIPPAAPVDPRSVYLLDLGRHASLVVPGGDGNLIRYAYGHWEWYALAETGPAQGTRAVFGTTPAALGRRELSGPATEAGVKRSVLVPIEDMFTIQAEASKIEQLRRELDTIFHSSLDTLVYNRLYDLEFVRHPVPYSLRHNSNRVVADWFKELGCEIRGSTIFSNWKVKKGR